MPYSDPFTALAYGPVVDERKRAQMIGAYDNPLTPQDIALSPNRLKQFPLGSWVQATDAQGNPIGKYRVGDTSYYTKDKPTTDTVEFRDADRSGQQVHLSPLGPGQVPGPGEVPPAMAMAAGPAAAASPNILQNVLANYGPTATPEQPDTNLVADFLNNFYSLQSQFVPQRRRFPYG
jgi:hypothetical protein